jgi:ribosomal protein S18 acetylase RimI-like enzyme
VLIRSFAWADYEAVTALWQSTGREVVPRAELTAKLARDPELFLVAEGADAAIAGVVMGAYDGRRGWILRLAADPGRRRAGIASALVTEVETRLAALGCPRINLLVMPDNAPALKFWQSRGYLPAPDVLCTKPLPGND